MVYVLMYLGAIVAANLMAARFGPAVTVLNAFLFIGFDLTARDRLHEAWHGEHLAAKMGALIVAGSALSWMVNADAAQIALASCVAFGLAAIADTVVFGVLFDRERLVRMNGSNAVAAAVDSVVFQTIAFGALMPLIVLGQLAAKVLGGALWSLVLTRRRGLVDEGGDDDAPVR